MKSIVFVLGELNVDLIADGTNIMPEWNREKFIDDFMDIYFVSVVGKTNMDLFVLSS